MSEAYPYWESSVAVQLGLSRDDIRALRDEKLARGKDWELVGNRVCYADSGVDAMKSLTAAARQQKAAVSVPEKNGAPAGRAVTLLEVYNAGLKNRHIVLAHPPGKPAEIVRVWVKSADNFRRTDPEGKPMVLKAAHKQADLYELVGPCPRRPGKW